MFRWLLGGNRDYRFTHTVGQMRRVAYAPFLRFYPCLRTLLPVFRTRSNRLGCFFFCAFFEKSGFFSGGRGAFSTGTCAAEESCPAVTWGCPAPLFLDRKSVQRYNGSESFERVIFHARTVQNLSYSKGYCDGCRLSLIRWSSFCYALFGI